MPKKTLEEIIKEYNLADLVAEEVNLEDFEIDVEEYETY